MHPWILLSPASYYCTLESGVRHISAHVWREKECQGLKKVFLRKADVVSPKDRLRIRKQDDSEGQIFNNPLTSFVTPSASLSPRESHNRIQLRITIYPQEWLK